MSSLDGGGYRGYNKEKKGRPYRFYSLVKNPLGMMLRRKGVIAVIVISFFFLFFSVMEIALTQPFEDAQKDLMSFDKGGAYFDIRPSPGHDLETEVLLGENITLGYDITNVGSESSLPYFILYVPNEDFELRMEQPLVQLPPGGEMTLEVGISVPGGWSNFSRIAPPSLTQAIIDSGLSGSIPKELPEGRLSGDEGKSSDIFSEYLPDPFTRFAYSRMYEQRFARLVMLYAVPDSVIEPLINGDVGVRMADPAVSSLTSLLQLDIHEEELFRHSDARPAETLGDTFDIVVEKVSEPPFETEMYPDDTREIMIEVRNTAGYPVEVVMEALVMPVTDPEWWVEIYPLVDPRNNPKAVIGPGESITFMMTVVSGFFDAEIPYNIVLLATDVSSEQYWNSEMFQLVVKIDADRPSSELEKEYFDIMWGGGFHYNRFLWMILLTAVAGSTLISNDLKNNTLALYFSRPITWLDYLLGKWTALFIVLSIITIVPAFVLFVAEVSFMNEGWTFILSKTWLLGSAMITYTAALVVFTSVALAFSSLSKRWIVAGVGIFSSFLITPIISDMLVNLFETDHLKLININLVMKYAFTPLFGLEYDADAVGISYVLHVLVMFLITSLCWAVMVLKFRGREVVR
ncbi:MAG: ABC transporter permease subunit [Thermoplasmatota archaeon]